MPSADRLHKRYLSDLCCAHDPLARRHDEVECVLTLPVSMIAADASCWGLP